MKSDWKRAAVSGDAEAVRALLTSGRDVNALDRYGQTALMLAAHNGHVLVVHELIAHGADLNHTAKFGLSALMLAIIADRPEVVRVLVKAGADTTLKGTGTHQLRRTPLELADSMGRVKCADVLRTED